MPGRVFIFENNEDNAFRLGEMLKHAGWALAMALMVLGREPEY